MGWRCSEEDHTPNPLKSVHLNPRKKPLIAAFFAGEEEKERDRGSRQSATARGLTNPTLPVPLRVSEVEPRPL